MSGFKSQQCHLTIRDRAFHFVSYEGQPANVPKNEAARPAMWYLMVEGRRFPSLVCDPKQTDIEIEHSLTRWAIENAVARTAPIAHAAPTARKRSAS